MTERGTKALSDLEWAGLTVFAARRLELRIADAHILVKIVRRAPSLVPFSMLDGAPIRLRDGRGDFPKDRVKTSIVKIRRSLVQVGIRNSILTERGIGYAMNREDADRVLSFVLNRTGDDDS